MRVAILPTIEGPDRGDGGIRRVIEAQERWLPEFGWDVVDIADRPDLVATHAAVAVVAPATMPLVSHCHGLYWSGYDWERWALKMNRDVIRSMRRADVVTAPSEWVAQAIRRGSQIDPVVLYHGVDPDEWWHASDAVDPYVLWNKTRLDPICDPTPVYELAKRARSTRFVTTLGVGSTLGETDAVGSLQNVHPIGVLPYESSRAVVRNAAVYLCTTRETFGIGTLEAMASEVPVLAWDWGGQHEIVRHLETGYLARVDDYDDLLDGLQWCLQHGRRAGRAAREDVLERWTWRQAIRRYADLYERLAVPSAGARVSVVMPCYNMEAYIGDAIRSVREQSYDDWELVVVDDASTDSSMDVVTSAARSDPRIRIVTNATNQYLAESLNVGIANSRGRYIVPLDPDNMLGHDVLGLLVASLDSDRDVDIVYGSMSVIEPSGEEWTSTWPTQFQFRAQLRHRNQITSTSMYRRSVWERVGGYRRRCRTAEDADFWCRTTSFGAQARKVTDAVVLRYRNRADSMSHVQSDWAWNDWYPWGRDPSLTPWIVATGDEREEPVIPTFETPLVSVIIPVGPGHERLVLDALDSLNAQTFRWWEAIVVNDMGAPLPWVPSWARVVDTTGPRGAGVARNLGMGISRGRFFTFLDADDYLQPRALELMVDTWVKVGGGFVYSDWYKAESGDTYYAPEWDGCESVLRQLPWSVTCLYPRSAWDATGGFDTELTAWEDWDFAIRVIQAGYCGTRIAVPLLHYRIESGARRESGFANREDLKEKILARWAPYITGDVPMPCGCSGGGGLPSLPALDVTGSAPRPVQIAGVDVNQMILLEFVEDAPAPLTYTGRVTGTRYRFGADDDNRVRWVYRTDAESLLTRDEFKVYNEVDGGTPLVAVGPPR